MQTHMPIGYKMVDGKIHVDKEKAKTVQWIFKSYSNGKSLIGIAKELKENQIPNSNNKINWTHSAVGRILENIKYMGDDFYPPLISKEQYEQAKKLRKQKEEQLGRLPQLNSMKNANIFSDKITCGDCGDPYRKYVEHAGKPSEKVRWKCKKYIYKNKVQCTNVFYTDDELKQIAVNAINVLISNPKLIDKQPPKEPMRLNKELSEIEYNIKTMKENEEFSSVELVNLLYKRAQLVYQDSKIDDYAVRTERIKETLLNQEKLIEFQDEIFKEIISKLIIYRYGTVETYFINGFKISEVVENKRKDENYGCKQKDSGNHTATDEI